MGLVWESNSPALKSQRLEDVYKFENRLTYMESSKSANATWKNQSIIICMCLKLKMNWYNFIILTLDVHGDTSRDKKEIKSSSAETTAGIFPVSSGTWI